MRIELRSIRCSLKEQTIAVPNQTVTCLKECRVDKVMTYPRQAVTSDNVTINIDGVLYVKVSRGSRGYRSLSVQPVFHHAHQSNRAALGAERSKMSAHSTCFSAFVTLHIAPPYESESLLACEPLCCCHSQARITAIVFHVADICSSITPDCLSFSSSCDENFSEYGSFEDCGSRKSIVWGARPVICCHTGSSIVCLAVFLVRRNHAVI